LTQGIWYPNYCSSPQDLAQGAASQQKLIDAAAAVSSRTEHAEVTERQLKSLPAKLAQIQGSSAAAADADVAEDAVEADMDEEAEESGDEDELGSISSGKDSEIDDDEEVADAEEGTGADLGALAAGAPMERESASAREGEAQLASAGESLLDATSCPSWVLSPLIMCCCYENLSTALGSCSKIFQIMLVAPGSVLVQETCLLSGMRNVSCQYMLHLCSGNC